MRGKMGIQDTELAFTLARLESSLNALAESRSRVGDALHDAIIELTQQIEDFEKATSSSTRVMRRESYRLQPTGRRTAA